MTQRNPNARCADVVVIIAAMVLATTTMLHAVPDRTGAERPNILFAIADDWSFGHASAYGCRWVSTPHFDRVARGGILFTHAYTPNAKCAPSRASILTGRNSWQLGEAANHMCFFPPQLRVVTEALAAAGYFTGHTAKGWGPGVAVDAAGKPRELTGRAFNARRLPQSARGLGVFDYGSNFADFLDAAPAGSPWFFWYGGFEPHRDYEYGSGVAKGGKSLRDIDRVPGYWPDNETVRNDMLDYAYEVEHFDRHLGRMLALLEERGQLENTLVIVTSDHGMPFPRIKGQAYDASNRVPLAIMWPRGIRTSGRIVDDYISFIDLAPTFVEMAGMSWEQTGMDPSPGRSLSDIFHSDKSGRVNPLRDHVLIGKERHDVGRPDDVGYPIRGMVKDEMLYLRNYEPSRWPAGNPEAGYLNCDASPTKLVILRARRASGRDPFWDLCFGRRPAEELYDLKNDPDCLRNLAEGGRQTIKQRLEDQMVAELKAQGDPRMFGQGEVFDRYPYSSPGTRNFYNRLIAGERIRAGWADEDDFEKVPLD